MGRLEKYKGRCLDILLCLVAAMVCAPIVLVVLSSFKSGWELKENLLPILEESSKKEHWKILPCYPEISHYSKLLLKTPQFFVVFWNSIKMTGIILLGQAVVAIPSGWAFAKFRFRGRKLIMSIYIILMLMPFQVTMLPTYLVMERLGLMNTQASIILPAVFSTFPVFIIYRGFLEIPDELIEAAYMDGANDFQIIFRVIIPIIKPAIATVGILAFQQVWSNVETSNIFVTEETLKTFAFYMNTLTASTAGNTIVGVGMQAAATVLMFLPNLIIFIFMQSKVMATMAHSGIK